MSRALGMALHGILEEQSTRIVSAFVASINKKANSNITNLCIVDCRKQHIGENSDRIGATATEVEIESTEAITSNSVHLADPVGWWSRFSACWELLWSRNNGSHKSSVSFSPITNEEGINSASHVVDSLQSPSRIDPPTSSVAHIGWGSSQATIRIVNSIYAADWFLSPLRIPEVLKRLPSVYSCPILIDEVGDCWQGLHFQGVGIFWWNDKTDMPVNLNGEDFVRLCTTNVDMLTGYSNRFFRT